MGESGQDKISAFDTLFTNNHIQMLKILYSHLDRSAQKAIAVYIKFLELQYTLAFFRQTPLPCHERQNSPDIASLCDEIMPFCDTKEKEKLQNLRNMLKNFENMQEMMQMMEIIKDFMPEGGNGSASPTDFSSVIDFMSGMNQASSMDLTSAMNLASGMDLSSLANIFQNNSDN